MDIQKKIPVFNRKQMLIWLAALLVGSAAGALNCAGLNEFFDFIAKIYTRLFKFLAVPTIALAITTTLAGLGKRRDTGKIFLYTLVYTLLTTVAAAAVGAVLYWLVKPGNLPQELIAQQQTVGSDLVPLGVYGHILSVVPDNILTPFAAGNVLCIVLIAAAAGLALASRQENREIQLLTSCINGLQELLFTLIKALVWSLPLGIVAFAGQLAAQMSAGVAVESLGKYILVVLGGNVLQFFVILPLFLLTRRINPLYVFRCMLPAVLMAIFTKSSAATLPVTIASAENNLRTKPEVARFVLPICCTINMNGCAAFILTTSLFVMQNGGVELTAGTVVLWCAIAVISAIGNAGVPMGCYFLTLSLMSGINMPIGVLGLILPVYAVIDMIETGVNVWSDACVCAIVDKAVEPEENISSIQG